MYSALFILNTTTEVSLSKTPNPRLLPGCPLLRVCVCVYVCVRVRVCVCARVSTYVSVCGVCVHVSVTKCTLFY